MMRTLSRWMLAVLVLLGAACGGNDDSGELISRVGIATQDIESVEITGAVPVFSTGDELPLQLLATSSTGSVSSVTGVARWSSSDPAVASVSQDGVVTGLADGTVDVRASHGPFSNTVAVQVSSAPLESIAITAGVTQFNECTSLQLSADGTYQGDGTDVRTITNTVDWQVADGIDEADIASFNTADPAGFLRANGAGAIGVTASQDGISSPVFALEALAMLDDGGIRIDEPASAITVGTSLVYRAFANFSDGAQNVDISDNADWSLTVIEGTAQFATVSNTVPNKGTVTATQAGGGTLSVSCGGVSTEIDVRAEFAPTIREVFISPEQDSLNVDVDTDVAVLQGFVLFSDGTEEEITELAEWTSEGDLRALDLSDSSGSRGVITINGVGQIVATMVYERNGIRFTRQITVTASVF